jgi:hypothetical protein
MKVKRQGTILVTGSLLEDAGVWHPVITGPNGAVVFDGYADRDEAIAELEYLQALTGAMLTAMGVDVIRPSNS